jgi:Tfp pilus assembly protein PilV
MRMNYCTRLTEPNKTRVVRLRSPQGVALILVMLAMLVLSVLAASIVFTARSETFASVNYKLDTQADYLAKAGIQRTVNWLRSGRYQAATVNQANTYYNVTQVDPVTYPNLYTSDNSPVQCKAASVTGGCSTAGAIVQLMAYGSGVSNYPTDPGTLGPILANVAPNFASDMNDPALTNNRISGDAANSGYYKVDATMLSYQTVNVTPPPAQISVLPCLAGQPCPPTSCIGTANPAIVTCPVETWLVSARGTWTGPTAATATVATAEEIATLQPIYFPTYGNALYGFCSVSLAGSSGTCTDAFNSAIGAYGNGTNATASGACGTNTGNVIDTGAGVGANGGVTLGSNVTVGGNVTIGSSPSAGCAASGYSGSTSSVLGEVIDGPHINPPPTATFPVGPPTFPGSSPSFTGGTKLTGSSTATLPNEDMVPADLFNPLNPAGLDLTHAWPYPLKSPPAAPNAYPIPPDSITDCMTPGTCGPFPLRNDANGTATHPYTLGTIDMDGSSVLNLTGGSSPYNPVYYDIDQLNQTGGTIVVSGYVVLNVKTSLTLAGNGVTGSTAAGYEIPPQGIVINYAGTNTVTINGNGATCSLINAPNATVKLGGGGSTGYMIGSIQANNVIDQGGYPVHYDIQLAKAGGTLSTMVNTAYSRRKM